MSDDRRLDKDEWAVLDILRAHYYDTRTRGAKPDDPGWHACSCGWGGYWSDWQPHVATKVAAQLRDLDSVRWPKSWPERWPE